MVPEDFIKEFNLSNLSPEEREAAIGRINLLVYQAVLVKSLDILSVKEEEELDRLLDRNETTTKDVFTYLALKIPTFDLLLKEECQKVKEDVLVTA